MFGGFQVTEHNSETVLDLCEERLQVDQSVHICTLNPEIGYMAISDPEYGNIDFCSIDGIGICLAVLRRHGRLPRRLTGVTLMQVLCDWARDTERDVAIIGASPASRTRAEARLREMGVRVREGSSPVVGERGESDPLPREWWPVRGVVLVALGAPKQEFWIHRQIENGTPPNVFIGVGGSVDYLSGLATVPPGFMKLLGMEWLYRLLREPHKRLHRQLSILPRFLWQEIIRGQ